MTMPDRSSKPYKIKAPPQLSALFPLLLSYHLDIRSSRGGNSRIIRRLQIDLSGVDEIDVLGAVAFASNLAKSMELHPEFEIQIIQPNDRTVLSFLENLRFTRLLLQLGMNVNITPDFWREDEIDKEINSIHFPNGNELLLFIPKVPQNEREKVLGKLLKEVKTFLKMHASANINHTQLHPIFHEIIKNTIDHSSNVGILALKITYLEKTSHQLHFVHCEMGRGIALHVRDYLSQSSDPVEIRLADKGSTSDFLQWAFTPGKSTKLHSGVNAGLGLASIKAAAKGGNIRVYCSDARSIAYVTEFPTEPTHKQLRKRLYHTHPVPCFMYFGETNPKVKRNA
ncbi:MAG: ATP-binding protein [Rhodoferax sp.]